MSSNCAATMLAIVAPRSHGRCLVRTLAVPRRTRCRRARLPAVGIHRPQVCAPHPLSSDPLVPGPDMTPHPFDLTGKVALVTGAYRGLGFAIARGLARAGATVVLNGRKQDVLDQAAASLTAQKLKVTTAVFDLTDRDAIHTSVAAIGAQHGAI